MADKPVRQLVFDKNSKTEFYPKQLMQNVLDGEQGENLYSYLSRFNHINVGYVVSKESARNAIPNIYRKTGFIITYYIDTKPTTEQFNGSNTDAGNSNWTKDTYWSIVDGVAEIEDNSITLSKLSKEVIDLLTLGNNVITNYPDGEDLTEYNVCGTNSKNIINVLKFADKEYNSVSFSGLGRVYLRKNIIETNNDGTISHNNILTQDMINKANTIYIIQYDYDLNGAAINIPEGSVLNFQGGSFNNGTFVYNRPTKVNVGFSHFDTTLNKPIWWDGSKWIDSEGNDADSTPITSGTFANKPTGVEIGFAYFCTDKQTTEGVTNGIMIYYKGDNVWVDALGRVVS